MEEREIADEKEEEKELENILRESPLYLDMSLRDKEKFLHYLVSIVLR